MSRKKEYTPPVYIGQNLYVRPSYIVSIPEFHRENAGRSVSFLANQENLKNNETNGGLSRKAVTGLRNSINWLCLAAKKKRVFVRKENKNFFFKVNFVTLTLPDTSEEITPADLQKKLLNPFLTYFRQFHGLKNYVWRLEFQKNGKLHVHLTCDTFLHHRKVRDTWNGLLARNGYLKDFLKKYGHLDPNSTDIHATRKVKDMAAYLAKYMSKKEKPVPGQAEEKKVLKGRIWGCSREISRANKLSVHIPADQCAVELKCLMASDIPYQDIYAQPTKTEQKYAPYMSAPPAPRKIGEVFFLKAEDWVTKITGKVREVFDVVKWRISRANEAVPVFEL